MLKLMCIVAVFCAIGVNCSLGKANFSSRIIGGTESVPPPPFYASIIFSFSSAPSSRYFCGASIIKEDAALTAAHCTVDSNGITANTMTLYAGFVSFADFNDPSKGQIADIPQSYIFPHPNYGFGTNGYDIAVLRFTIPLNFNDGTVQAVPYARTQADYVTSFSQGIVYGRGITVTSLEGTINYLLTSTSPYISDKVQQLGIQLIGATACGLLFAQEVSSDKICGVYAIDGNLQPFKGACFGDSGGPATVNGVQVGVVSLVFGISQLIGGITQIKVYGCDPNSPNAYTNVATYATFIDQYANAILQ